MTVLRFAVAWMAVGVPTVLWACRRLGRRP